MADPSRAVVTGATGAIGSAICRRLAARGIGLILLDRSLAASEAFAGDLRRAFPALPIESFAVDLADRADVARAAASLVARYPAIAYLFNNAGVLTESPQVSKDGDELHAAVNALAPLRLIDGLRPALARAGGATILNTSAGLASGQKTLALGELLHPTQPFRKLFGPYVASKAALNVLTAALAPDLASDGIAIRAADPGPTKSPLTRGAGTPLWMRLFYAVLPGPQRSAATLVDVALAPRWRTRTGVFVSGGKVVALPPALADRAFQDRFLAACRAHDRDLAAGSRPAPA